MELKTINIKGKEYVQVNERIKHFRANFPKLSLVSEIIFHKDNQIVIIARVINENGQVIADGIAEETQGSSYINKTSYVENCQTSAWGRALGCLGIGIDSSIASAEELQSKDIDQGNKDKEDLEFQIKLDYEYNSIQGLRDLYKQTENKAHKARIMNRANELKTTTENLVRKDMGLDPKEGKETIGKAELHQYFVELDKLDHNQAVLEYNTLGASHLARKDGKFFFGDKEVVLEDSDWMDIQAIMIRPEKKPV